jgi:hypothetical protein
MNENGETVGASEAAQANAAAGAQAQGGGEGQGVGQAATAAQGNGSIVSDDDVLQGTTGARVDVAVESLAVAGAQAHEAGVTEHLANAGSEVVAAAGAAVEEVKAELTKLDTTVETFIRAHMNSVGRGIDHSEEVIAEAFVSAFNRIRGHE